MGIWYYYLLIFKNMRTFKDNVQRPLVLYAIEDLIAENIKADDKIVSMKLFINDAYIDRAIKLSYYLMIKNDYKVTLEFHNFGDKDESITSRNTFWMMEINYKNKNSSKTIFLYSLGDNSNYLD